jgi:hypothetical protein
VRQCGKNVKRFDCDFLDQIFIIKMSIPKPVWAVGFALEQTLRDATLAVFSFLILKRLQHNHITNNYHLTPHTPHNTKNDKTTFNRRSRQRKNYRIN